MYIRKQYGRGRINNCPFCSNQATSLNKQQIPVCKTHISAVLNENDLRCVCGSLLELKAGKFGVYFTCMNCGNINAWKVFEINRIVDANKNP